MQTAGRCNARFDGVREEFERNFRRRGEVGAAICVHLDGEPVVDLWGGIGDARTGAAWGADSVLMAWSCTKGAMSLCVHLLVDEGLLDLAQPVGHYWPAFGRGGRRAVTVSMLLNHQAGLPGVSQELPPGAVFDFPGMVERIAAEEPLWRPGTRHGYHSFTFGWLVGGLIARVTGLSPGAFLEANVAEPLGVPFWIGLPTSVAPHLVCAERGTEPRAGGGPDLFRAAVARGEPVQLAVDRSWGEFRRRDVEFVETARSAEVPAVNGVTNARGLAGLYAPLATDGAIGDRRLSHRSLALMASVESAAEVDAVTLTPSRFSSGFQKALPLGRRADVPRFPEAAFGHSGFGGSFGLADPSARLSIGYVTSGHVRGWDHARGQALIDATYRAVGVRMHG